MKIGSMQAGERTKRAALWRGAALALFLGLTLVGALTVGDYGMTWDERFRFQGGDRKLAYYEALFSGEAPEAMPDNYPGLFDLPLALAHKAFPEWGTRSEKGHVWSLCFGLLGILATWRTAARIGGERAGFWALILLAATPRYYGHMFFNPKDIPLAATYALGVWSLVALMQGMPRPPWRAAILVGLAAGLAMSARIAGALILFYFGLFIALYLGYHYARAYGVRQWPPNVSGILSDIRRWALRGVVAGMAALLPLSLFWPTLHADPLDRFTGTAEAVQGFGWGGSVLMEGLFYPADHLPFYYVFYWLGRTLPEMFLLLLIGGAVAGLLQLRRWSAAPAPPGPGRVLPPAVVAFAGLFPLCYIYFTQPVLYDGMRHFLFVLPPLAAAAALGLEFWLRRLERRFTGRTCRLAVVGLGAAIVLPAAEMVALHPYQYLYFNRLSGGLEGAYQRDETDYWGLSHKEAADWLNKHAATIDPAGTRRFKVHQRYSRWMLKEHLDPDRFEMTPERAGADFFVSITRFNLHTSYPEARLLHAVHRQGVPLCLVFRLPTAAE